MYFQNSLDKLSLYIHIPFCKSKCGYCDFYSKAKTEQIDLFLQALEIEIELHLLQSPQLADTRLETIFFGGGTPSVLSVEAWQKIALMLHQRFNFSQLKEFSIECNPESFTTQKAEAWLKSGVTRVSFGVQSLNPKELKASNRLHSRELVLELLNNPQLKDFQSISVDVIYGLPEQTEESLTETINRLLEFSIIKHISAYELTIAEGTPFEKREKELHLPSEEKIETLAEITFQLLKEHGFTRYEVSNYAQKGHESQHNKNYWNLTPYLSLGPSAHSFDGVYRFAKNSSLTQYCNILQKKELPISFSEKITKEMLLSEYLFLSLRTAQGVDLKKIKNIFHQPFLNKKRKKLIEQLQKRDILTHQNGSYHLTEKGLDFADGVATKLDI